MSKKVTVTRAQVAAAQLRTKVDRKAGRESSWAIRKIADAKPRHQQLPASAADGEQPDGRGRTDRSSGEPSSA